MTDETAFAPVTEASDARAGKIVALTFLKLAIRNN
jgi:hypothetical protein